MGEKDLEQKNEMKIIGFLCNWCSYGGADTAGVSRLKQPTDLRVSASRAREEWIRFLC